MSSKRVKPQFINLHQRLLLRSASATSAAALLKDVRPVKIKEDSTEGRQTRLQVCPLAFERRKEGDRRAFRGRRRSRCRCRRRRFVVVPPAVVAAAAAVDKAA